MMLVLAHDPRSIQASPHDLPPWVAFLHDEAAYKGLARVSPVISTCLCKIYRISQREVCQYSGVSDESRGVTCWLAMTSDQPLACLAFFQSLKALQPVRYTSVFRAC